MASGITTGNKTTIKDVKTKSNADITLDDLVTDANETVIGDVNTGGEITKIEKIIVGRPVRKINPGSAGSIDTLSGVDTTNAVDGDVLVYNDTSGNYESQLLLEKQILNGGTY